MPIRSAIRNSVSVSFSLFFLFSCQKKEVVLSSATEISQYEFAGYPAQVSISTADHRIWVRLDDTVKTTANMVARFQLSPGAVCTRDGAAQVSGTTPVDAEWDLNYEVTAQDKQHVQSWQVIATNNEYSFGWGLGHIVHQSVSNERSYSWYLDQGFTEPFSNVNCGPTSVTMAIKWADSGFTKTPVDARQQYEPGGGWWFTYDIDAYLTDNQIPHVIVPMQPTAEKARDHWARQIDSGRIIILCIDMNFIRNNHVDTYHTDKFYNTSPGWGHFFVIKGYRQVDQEFFFEIYDPASVGQANVDGSPIGENRYYRYSDVFDASSNWWNYSFIITSKGKYIDQYTAQQAVRSSDIKHAHGF